MFAERLLVEKSRNFLAFRESFVSRSFASLPILTLVLLVLLDRRRIGKLLLVLQIRLSSVSRRETFQRCENSREEGKRENLERSSLHFRDRVPRSRIVMRETENPPVKTLVDVARTDLRSKRSKI